MTISDLREKAERDDDGDLVYEREVRTRQGTTQTETVNLTALLTPGDRTSDDVSLLVLEAELLADGVQLDNPARPATADVAEDVLARLDDGVRPAWEVVE